MIYTKHYKSYIYVIHISVKAKDNSNSAMSSNKKIAFFVDVAELRGTTTALYDYADFNERILGNTSFVFVTDTPRNDARTLARFQERFNFRFALLEPDRKNQTLSQHDVVYVICSGAPLALNVAPAKLAVHAVFDGASPWGDAFAMVSRSMADAHKLDTWVPHIVRPVQWLGDNMRAELGIPPESVVFGYMGSITLFDLLGANAVGSVALTFPDRYFLFVFPDGPNEDMRREFTGCENVRFLAPIATEGRRHAFLRTLDAGIECNRLGHTFGLSIAEMSMMGIPVLCNDLAPWKNRAHLDILGDCAILYRTNVDLTFLLATFRKRPRDSRIRDRYADFSPEKVMKKFSEVFIGS